MSETTTTPPAGTGLPISVRTEDGRIRDRISAGELTKLMARLGRPGDRTVVATRLPDRPDVFLRVRREGSGPYEAEFRDGTADRYAATLRNTSQAGTLCLNWARGREGWRGGHDWRLVVPPPEPAADTRQEIEEYARELIHGGFEDLEEVIESVSEFFDRPQVTAAQAARIVEPLWQERLAEQESWPETTDPDRIAAVLDTLDRHGITARMHFSCCQTCGVAEIGEEAGDDARGYVFFHAQDTDTAVEGLGLYLSYGTFADSTGPAGAAAIGREVAEAFAAAGLGVEWDGSPNTRIRISPVDWLNRLPR
jgi:hypothetical protein